jgi:CheY-like chemotaxis protein
LARILIVDDDESDRMLLRTMLAGEGYETQLVADGDAALAAFHETPFDVVVTDLQMPNMHGLELISLLRDATRRPAIIALSGTGDAQLDVAQAIGADETLSKPVTQQQLLEAVSRAFGALWHRRVTDGG